MGLIFSNVPLFIYSDDVASFLCGSFIKFLCASSRTVYGVDKCFSNPVSVVHHRGAGYPCGRRKLMQAKNGVESNIYYKS